MDGGTVSGRVPLPSLEGLSPRGRGNPSIPIPATRTQRSIPAWAGEPYRAFPRCTRSRVYPRVGGGTAQGYTVEEIAKGLSPRGRGNHTPGIDLALYMGSIPAWAGEPSLDTRWPLLCWVYPRVGGGTLKGLCPPKPTTGLSPRGRGNPQQRRGGAVERRSIPAWAGEPGPVYLLPLPPTVYPRVGGGTGGSKDDLVNAIGLSPRGRGNRTLGQVHHFRPGLSPRGRGNLIGNLRGEPAARSIPAWAGEPYS